MSGLALLPVEDVCPGDEVFVHRTVGWRRVTSVSIGETATGPEPGERFWVVYDPAGPGQAWENRARAKGVVSTYERDAMALAVLRRGDVVQIRRAA